MPVIHTSVMAPDVPGLVVVDLGNGKYEWRGSVDALAAAGGDVRGIYGGLGYPTKVFTTPSGVKLRPFQDSGVREVLARERIHGWAILADEMGLGKTVEGAVVAENLRGDGSVLVVCPATVRHQWERWAEVVTGSPDEVWNLGPKSDKKYTLEWAGWEERGGWGVSSYNMMAQALAVRCPDIIIFDEPHNFLQGRGNTYIQALWKHVAKIRYKLALDGTPYLSKPAGLWSLLNVMGGMRFGRARAFDQRYCEGHDATHGWSNKGASNTPELRQRLQHYMVRRTKKEVGLELPPVSMSVRWVDGTQAARSAMANMTYSSDGMRKAMEPTLADKIPAVVDAVKEANAATVVFCWRREDCNRVGMALHKAREENMVIHGEHDAAARARHVQEARRRNCHVVTTYGASGTGLDGLQEFSSNLVYHAIDPVVAMILQSLARLDRIGQTSPVNAVAIAMHDSVDELTVDKVVNRVDTFRAILGDDKASGDLRQALIAGGVGDISNDKVLQAIFDEMT